jgi:hypothetical protein
MASKVTLEGIKKAVFFPFSGKNWGVKVVIGSVLGLANYIIPIVPGIAICGYYARIMKQIILQNKDPELPEWDDWGGLFLDGIKVFGAILLYMLPALLLVIFGYALFFVPYFTTMMTAVNSNTSNPDFTPIFGSMLAMFAGIPIMMLGIMLAFGTSMFIPPALGNMIAKGEFKAAFRMKEWWPVLRVNLSGFLLSLALVLGLFYMMYFGVVIMYMTVILCFLLPFLLVFIGFIAGASGMGLFSVAYRDGLQKLAK